jgi:hypothetical protein
MESTGAAIDRLVARLSDPNLSEYDEQVILRKIKKLKGLA